VGQAMRLVAEFSQHGDGYAPDTSDFT